MLNPGLTTRGLISWRRRWDGSPSYSENVRRRRTFSSGTLVLLDVEVLAGNHLLGDGRAAPLQAGYCPSLVLVVLQLDVVFLSCRQFDLALVFGGTVQGPVADQLLAIDPESYTVVAAGVEGVGAGGRGDNLTSPADAEGIGADLGVGRTVAPIEADRVVDAGDGCAGEVGVVEERPSGHGYQWAAALELPWAWELAWGWASASESAWVLPLAWAYAWGSGSERP